VLVCLAKQEDFRNGIQSVTRFATTFIVRKYSAFQRVQFDARMSLLCKKNVSDVFFRVHRVRKRERERERERE
jgi:hypothetical protein